MNRPNRNSKSADVRTRLSHPVIDMDAHLVEFVPAFLDYLKEVGRDLAARDGVRWRDVPESVWLPPVREFTIAAMMVLIRADLLARGIVLEDGAGGTTWRRSN